MFISNLILPKMLRNFMRKLYNISDLDKKKNTVENNGLDVPKLCFENSKYFDILTQCLFNHSNPKLIKSMLTQCCRDVN